MTLKELKEVIKKVEQGQPFKASELANVLMICKKVYYNSGEGLSAPVAKWFEANITDEKFDYLEDCLRAKNPNHAYFKQIGAKVANASERKAKLPFHAPSLDKIKPGMKQLATFIDKSTTDFVLSDKIDGVSLLILTKDKKLFTRGDGSIGQDISHLWNSLGLPKKVTADLKVRGEMVIPEAAFQKILKTNSDLKNARNTMSGLVNSAKPSPLWRHAKVFCYQVVGKKPSEAFAILARAGFNTPWHKTYKSLTQDKLATILAKRKQEAEYQIDGIVVSRDVREMPTTSNPTNSVAFKSPEAEEMKQFVVKEVQWQLSKHSAYKPVLILEPQKLDGVTVGKCTAHNAKFVWDNKLGPKAIVAIRRSGQVIPYCDKVIKQARKAQMPSGDWEWDKTNVNVFLPAGQTSDVVKIKKITNFFRTLGAEHISEATFTKLYNNGLNTVAKLIKVGKNKLMSIDGFQERSANMFIEQVHKAVSSVPLAKYMYASGCFPATVGSTRIEQILNKFPNVMEMAEDGLEGKITSLEGFSNITAAGFVAGLLEFKKFAHKLGTLVTVTKARKPKAKSKKLAGIFVVETGLRFSEAMKQAITENGGVVQSGVNKDTTHLVAKDPNGSSGKITKAKANGVKVVSLDAFIQIAKKKGVTL